MKKTRRSEVVPPEIAQLVAEIKLAEDVIGLAHATKIHAMAKLGEWLNRREAAAKLAESSS